MSPGLSCPIVTVFTWLVSNSPTLIQLFSTLMRIVGMYSVLCCCSVAKLCLTLCDSMEWNMPGSPVPHHLLEFVQVHVHCIGDAIQPYCPLSPSFPSAFNLSQYQCLFHMSQFFPSGGQSNGVSASALVLPMNIQDWFPLGWTGWVPLQSKGLSRVFSNTTV